MESCPLGTFSVHDEKGMRCQRCEKDCRVCNEKMCLDCEMGTNLVQHPEGRTLCVRECPAGTFMHMERRMCQRKFSILNTISLPYELQIMLRP